MKPLFKLRGKVKKGKNRGKFLGFPTANINLHKKIPQGIYASTVKIDSPRFAGEAGNKKYIAATFIGSAKTFNESEYKAESYILDFNQNIYGKWVTVTLLKKLRGNKKFGSEQELIDQMKQDILATRKFFNLFFHRYD
ncbi:MAG: riboflavin kinase [Patescibacteria group bacterium]|nr:riboflavin kinase [Patescibacteria group bacterium]